MEYQFQMTNIMDLMKSEGPSKQVDYGKARIFEDEVEVCDRFNRKNCYDPDSLKKAFHPLGIFSKIFGLFPCYDFSFIENKLGDDSKKLRIIHCLDYCYSALIFILLTAGAIICFIYEPTLLKTGLINIEVNFDYYVKMILIYATIITGIQSLFIFPMKWNSVLKFVMLMSNIDKILRFDGRNEERYFAYKVIYYMIGCLVFTFASYFILFVHDGKDETLCFTDYLMPPIMTLALMSVVIPTGLAVFFVNAVRLRMEHFNRKMANMVKAFIPSCENCASFQDYGNELAHNQMDKQKLHDLPDDLEKMRILYSEIKTLGGCLSCIFGVHLVRDFLYSLVALTFYTYFLLNFQEEGVYIGLMNVGQGIFIIMKILVLVCFTQLIHYQGVTLDGILQRVSLRRIPESCILQIQAFLAISTKPPNISASGFFNVNKALMTSITASIATYFIILLQFKINGKCHGYGSGNNVTV